MAITALEQTEPQEGDNCKSNRPTGYWIMGKFTNDDIRYNDTSYKCNKCGKVVDFEENYCPNCGADIRIQHQK